MEIAPNEPAEMTASLAWAKLRETAVGRLAVVVDGQPEIFPVNYVVDHGSIVFRTSEGTKLSGAIDHRVAFEVDSYRPRTGEAWSVVAKGVAREVAELYELVDTLALPLFPWHAAPRRRVVRLEPDVLTGRQFRAVTPQGRGVDASTGASTARGPC